MLRLLCRAVLLAALLLSPLAQALTIPTLSQRVEDLAGVLQPQSRNQLEQVLTEYEQRTGHQFAVLTIPTLAGESLEGFSMQVAEAWRLGDKRRSDGLLVVLALQERRARIEVGYGLEGVVTDVVAGRVISQSMAPQFRRGDYAAGLIAGLQSLMQAAEGESTGAAKNHNQRKGEESARDVASWVGPAVILLILLFMSGAGRRRRRGGFFMLPPIGMGGWTSGGRGGGFGGGGGGFSGGGGGFGGGGASGDW